MGSKIIVASIAVELCVVLVAASGCASGSKPTGFGDTPQPATGTQAMPLGTYPASPSLAQKYGIAEWRTYVGKTQIVVTGYRADGTAARGVQLAWYASAPSSVGHTRVTMLDGTNAVLRRMVGGGETGHLSTEQTDLLQTMRYDLQRAPRPASTPLHGSSFGGGTGGLHLLDDSTGGTYGTTPNSGPQCIQAWADPSIPIDGVGCAYGVATFVDVMGAVVAAGTCTQWYAESKNAQATCDSENGASCNGDTCNFQQGTGNTQPPMPQQQCDDACLCANYGVAGGAPCNQTCVDNNACGSGQECHWGSCGPAPVKNDNPTDQNVSQQGPGAPSCGSGDVTADPSNGQVGCSSNNASGGSSGGGSGSSSGTDPGGTDPTSGGSSSGGSSSGGSSSGGSCADDGAGCAQDSDCCLGACNAGTCGTSGGDGTGSSSGGSSSGSGSSSGGGCAADGEACAQDSDCCSGACDTTSGTCGAGSGSSSSGGSSSGGSSGSSSGGSCAPDGSACAQDSDCCGGSCDTASGTCGAPSGSSSGGGSGSSSGGGCGNPGDPCGQDSDCCSGSCDTGSGTCN